MTHDTDHVAYAADYMIEIIASRGWAATVTKLPVPPTDVYVATAMRGARVPGTDRLYTVQVRATAGTASEAVETLLYAVQQEGTIR